MGNKSKSDLVVEAREVLANASRIHALSDRDSANDRDVGGLVLSLCSELETLRSQHATQAENIAQMQAQEKTHREAIDAALVALELLRQWVGPPPKGPYDFDSLREDGWNTSTAAMVLLRASITPKGEQS